WKGDQSTNLHRERYEELQSALAEMRQRTAGLKARLEVVEQGVTDQDGRKALDVERLALLDEKHVERLGVLVNIDRSDSNTAEFQADQPARAESARAEHESLMAMQVRENALLTDLGPKHPKV